LNTATWFVRIWTWERERGRTENGEMLEDNELELDVVVGMHLEDSPSQYKISTGSGLRLTQYLVVCLTNALCPPPALLSPMTG
jgi:hypothetical protein